MFGDAIPRAASRVSPRRISGADPARTASGTLQGSASEERSGVTARKDAGPARLAPWSVPLGLALAFWPVWRWYAHRTLDASDEKWGLLALGTLLLLTLSRRRELPSANPPLGWLSVVVVAYAVAFPFSAPLVRALFAVTAVGIWLGGTNLGRKCGAGAWGLLVLSLPVMASVQFFLGYPLRVVAARATSLLLALGGIDASVQGTCLTWRGETVLVDAPCSGVRMLWAGAYLLCTLACFYGLPAVKTAAAAVPAFAALLLGNTARSTALFVKETGILHLPDWTHMAIGVAAFAAAAGCVLACVLLLKGKPTCIAPSFS
jgi:exosortase/archaeosortase family protein